MSTSHAMKATPGAGADEERALELLHTAAAKLDQISTYACTVLCQDRINGTMRKQERIQSLFRAPQSVYLRWLPGPHEGLQASYVPARDGKSSFMARETGLKGLVGAISLPHHSPIVDSMYPHHFRTHETSVHHLVGLATELVTKAQRAQKLRVRALEELDDRLLRRRATRVDCELSKEAKDGLFWSRVELFFEHDSQLPLHLRLHDFDGGLYGEYAFVDFKPNVSIAPTAFELKRL